MSQNPQIPTAADALATASQYDVSVDQKGSVRITNANQYCTEYGIKHGGTTACISKMLMAKGVAMIGSMLIVFVLSTCMHADSHVSGPILLAFLACIVAYDIFIGFRFIQPRRMRKIIFATLAWAVCGLGCIIGLFYLLAHI